MTTRIDVDLRLALKSFELAVRFQSDARALALFGPSGCGKTSILEAIAGWRNGVSGHVRVGERTLFDSSAGVDRAVEERGIGFVPQDALLWPHQTVAQNVTFGSARATEHGAGVDLRRVLEVLELGPLMNRNPESLSGGEAQRVALARALCSQPDLLLLDEPLGGLDRTLRRRILPYLVRVREAFDIPLLLVSHDPTDVHALCDEVVMLEQGRVTASGTPRALLSGAQLRATGFENVLSGEVRALHEGNATVAIEDGLDLRLPSSDLTIGERVLFSVRADDILLALQPVSGLSARNQLAARVEGIEQDGEDVHLTARAGDTDEGGAVFSVSLTPGAVNELGLAVGRELVLIIKSQACHRLA